MEHAEFTIQIRREALSTGEDIYVALCLELDIASQGETIEQAKANVTDAIELFFEAASPTETEQRLISTENGLNFLQSRLRKYAADSSYPSRA